MKGKVLAVFLVAVTILSLALFGCKGRVEKAAEAPITEAPEVTQPMQESVITTTEPSQTVATETIPPTAAPPMVEKPAPVTQEKDSRNKDIQKALKNAGFYTGAIDGKIGPKTKKAVAEFQKEKGLKADGKVGPKTWAELEKYLVTQ